MVEIVSARMRPEEANPLVPRGFGGPKFPEDTQNKFLANEDENAYVQLEVRSLCEQTNVKFPLRCSVTLHPLQNGFAWAARRTGICRKMPDTSHGPTGKMGGLVVGDASTNF